MYFYPRPPRGGRRQQRQRGPAVGAISIHALREEGDDNTMTATVTGDADFYPRPPRGGRLAMLFILSAGQKISIHALREEGDFFALPLVDTIMNFYPRPPRGGRLWQLLRLPDHRSISIHALREEGDRLYPGARAAPGKISIHALREEGDRSPSRSPSQAVNFYPRPPRGGRRTSSRR